MVLNTISIPAKGSRNNEGMARIECELNIGDTLTLSDKMNGAERPGRVKLERVSENLFVLEFITGPSE